MDYLRDQREAIWSADGPCPQRTDLAANETSDVCIVGAGISGLTTAYLLAKAGRSVLVLEAATVGAGETSRTTAHLSNAVDDRYFWIESIHGPEGARICAESHTRAVSVIEAIVEDERIECDFRRVDGYLFLPPGESGNVLRCELEASHRAGLREVEYLARAPISSFDTGPCLRFPAQGQFHPLNYLKGLAGAVERRGGRILTGTNATGVQEHYPLQVNTRDGHHVRAEHVVIATNAPFVDRVVMHTKQAAYRTYVIAGRIPRGSVPEALYWDTSGQAGDPSGPYHYVRVLSESQEAQQRLENEGGHSADPSLDYDMLIVGGEDHKTGQADDAHQRWDRLEQWARQRFPMLQSIEYRWSGQVLEPIDGVAFIGRNPGGPKGVFIATGDSGMGMTHGTIAGILISDLILGRPNTWEKLYDPARKCVRSIAEFARENFNVLVQLSDWLKPRFKPVAEIAVGEGAIVRKGLQLLAVYRDDDGVLHARSAVCPHLGCIVAWNSAEKSWDCPCHGSRFNRFGEVLNPPAVTSLAHADIEEVVFSR